MESESSNPTSAAAKAPDVQPAGPADSGPENSTGDVSSKPSAANVSSWAKLKISQPFGNSQDDSSGNAGKSAFSRFTSGLGLRLSPKSPQQDDSSEGTAGTSPTGFIGTLTKGFVDTSKNAVKAVQVKARHVVSQNKRRYQVPS